MPHSGSHESTHPKQILAIQTDSKSHQIFALNLEFTATSTTLKRSATSQFPLVSSSRYSIIQTR